MNIFKGLIIKELQFVKLYKKNLIFFTILFSFLCFVNDNIDLYFPVFIPLIFGMVATNSFVYDGQANSERYLLSLPLTKKDIIRSKYLYIFLFTMIGSILGVLLAIILQSIKDSSALVVDNIVSAGMGALFGIMLLQSFQVPILIKFGYEKGKFIQMIAIVLIMMIGSLISVSIMKITTYSLDEVLNMLKQYGFYIIAVVMIAIYIISYKVSYRLYKKKEI